MLLVVNGDSKLCAGVMGFVQAQQAVHGVLRYFAEHRKLLSCLYSLKALGVFPLKVVGDQGIDP